MRDATAAAGPRILDIGQCGFDGPAIRQVLRERLGADVTDAATAAAADRLLGESGFDLILVNRVFASDRDSGLDWIERYKTGGGETPVMLVSDLADAQQTAVRSGAVRGFGKSRLRADETLDSIRDAVGGE